MPRYTGRGAQSLVQSKFGFVSIAALLCLSAAPRLVAEEATPAQPPGAQQKQPESAKKGEVTLPTVKIDQTRRPVAKRTKAAPRPAPKRLPPAPRQPTTTEPPAGVATPGTNYQVGNSGVGRLTTPLTSTPQSVTVVPRQIINEQASSTVMDALRNVPGITFRAGEGGFQGDVPYIRGFDSRNDIFRDGVRDPGWYTRDSFAIESVEVLKGPSSFMFGRGSTGGVINLLTRYPVWGQNYTEVTATAHTGPGIRSVLDANQQLGPNAAARVQVMGQRYDIPDRDSVQENRWGVAPSFSYKFNDRTRATVSYIYQHDDSIPDRGLPYLPATWGLPRYPAPAPRGVFYGITGGATPDQERINAHIATARVEHDITNDIKVTNTTRYVNVDRFNRATLPNNFTPAPGTNLATFLYNPGRQHTEVQNELLANNTDVSAKFTTGFLRHNLVTGIDFAREDRSQKTRPFTANSADPTNFYDPDPNRFGGTFGALTVPTISQATSGGAYLADQVKIGRYFEVLGGVRYDHFESKSGSTTAGFFQTTDRTFSWRVGGVFHPTGDESSSIYVMRGTSFNPTAEFLTIAAASANLAPEENVTTEIGAKWEVLNRRLVLTGAIFRTDKTNARIPDPANLTVNILDGLTRVEGIELGAVGRITNEWQVFAGYTYLRSELVSHPTLAGNELLNTPRNSFSLWSTYDIDNRWTVGGGAYFVNSVWGNAENTTIVPSYWRFDAMTSYKVTNNVTVQVNLYNLTNEYYFAQVYNNWAVPGPGRSAALTVRGRW